MKEVIRKRTRTEAGLVVSSENGESVLLELQIPGKSNSVSVDMDGKDIAFLSKVLSEVIASEWVEGKKRTYTAECFSCREQVNVEVSYKVPLQIKVLSDECPKCRVRVSAVILEGGKFVLI